MHLFGLLSVAVLFEVVFEAGCCNMRSAPKERRNNVISVDRAEQLTPGFKVHWTVRNDTILFDVQANTTGFVGLGISPHGGMEGADIVVGGVDGKTNKTYFHDMHALGHSRPLDDAQQNYHLVSATEKDGFTRLIFSRNLTTVDDNDAPITFGNTFFIWAMGSSDTITYHGATRGSFPVNILAPPKL